VQSLANALLAPKEDTVCGELHSRLLADINVGMK
jgi:hypothetical protein